MASHSDPTAEQIDKQCATMCAHELFSKRSASILTALVQAAKVKTEITSKELATEIFKFVPTGNDKADAAKLTELDTRMRTALSLFRHKLIAYNAGPGRDHQDQNPVIIEWKRGDVGLKCHLRSSDQPNVVQEPPSVHQRVQADTPTVGTNSEFEEFFGCLPGEPGAIILQADTIDYLTRGWVPPRLLKNIRGEHRPFKARRWINACDTEGALAIRRAFYTRNQPLPTICFSERGKNVESSPKAPFEISMGGFTSKVRREIEDIGRGWMQLKIGEPGDDRFGDGLRLLKKFAPSIGRFNQPGRDGFVRVLPSGWDDRYMNKFLAKLADSGEPSPMDLAVIIRHRSSHKIHFCVVGWTEVATAAAGIFLAERWHELWRDFVGGSKNKANRGNFLVLIEGPSDLPRLYPMITGTSEDLGHWKRTLAITPKDLKGISCLWTDPKEKPSPAKQSRRGPARRPSRRAGGR
jgi:hypothetical protein